MSGIRGDELFQCNLFPISSFPDIACYAAFLVPKNETNDDKNIIVLRLDGHTIYYDFAVEWKWCITIDNAMFWCLPIRQGSIGFLVRESEMIQYIFLVFEKNSIITHFGPGCAIELNRVYHAITSQKVIYCKLQSVTKICFLDYSNICGSNNGANSV
jgi:hypothetical protein